MKRRWPVALGSLLFLLFALVDAIRGKPDSLAAPGELALAWIFADEYERRRKKGGLQRIP